MAQPEFRLFTSLRYDPLLLSLPANTLSWPHSLDSAHTPSPFYMASFHRDRLLRAAAHFVWPAAVSKINGPEGFDNFLTALDAAINTKSCHPLRVRVLLNHEGEIIIESNAMPEVSQCNLFPLRLPPPQGQIKTASVSPLTGGALTLGSGDHIHGDPSSSPVWDIIPDPSSTVKSPYTMYKTTSRDMYNAARQRAGIKDGETKEVLIGSEEGIVMEGSLTSVFFWRDGRWVTPTVESGGQDGTTRRWALEMGLAVERIVTVDSLVEGEECWISNGVRGFISGKVKFLN